MKAVDEEADRQIYQTSATWGFRRAPTDGGRDYGNANVWSFDPTLEILVREVLQNTLDAAPPGGGQVKVVFRLIHLRGDDLRNYLRALMWETLREHLDASGKSGQKLGTLIKDGLEELRDTDEMLLLVVEDSGTSGLVGSEKGSGKFAALCRNNLDSNKEDSGSKRGAFGLGKAVLWRASRFATVIFCSNLSRATEDGQSQLRILGRSDLPWHECRGRDYAGPGWFGMSNRDDENDAARIRLKAVRRTTRVEPAVVFLGETGGGRTVRWERLETQGGCSVGGRQLMIPPGTREVRISGITDSNTHPVPAKDSCIVVELLKVAQIGGVL